MPELVANGVRLNYMRLGDAGPVIVCLHGLAMDNLSSFYLSIGPAIAKQASVIMYDLRGHGRSQQTASGYTTDDMVADLLGLIDGLGLGDRRVILLGNSFGGHVALRFAELYPRRVQGLILLDAHSGVADLGEQVAGTLQLTGDERFAKVQELFSHWLAKHAARGHLDSQEPVADQLDADGRATLQRVNRLGARRRSPLVRTAEALTTETSFVTDIAATQPIEDETLTKIDLPVLAVYGADSDIRSDGERLAALMPHCRLEIVNECAHGVIWQGRDQVIAAVESWLPSVKEAAFL